ncbi:hypothetical protein TcWFU_000647 [Taenia crassiceps]|uniref:Uncharacterized protein n=1 Tax=Taenia crassiceps TaxID=6207 RepID=A0ABR4QFK6_9CEST
MAFAFVLRGRRSQLRQCACPMDGGELVTHTLYHPVFLPADLSRWKLKQLVPSLHNSCFCYLTNTLQVIKQREEVKSDTREEKIRKKVIFYLGHVKPTASPPPHTYPHNHHID